MAWLDWLLNLWVLVPLAGLIAALHEFGRLILVEKRNLVPATAGSRPQRNAQRRLWLERLKAILEGQEEDQAA